MTTFLAAIAALFALLAGSGRAQTEAVRFTLVETGVSPGDTATGTFTASTPFCTSGSFVRQTHIGQRGGQLEATGTYTCADGSGTITASYDGPDETQVGLAPGRWQIRSGTGLYARLRGKGTATTFVTGFDPSNFDVVSFQTTWRGLAAFDDTAPSARFERVVARAYPTGVYRLRVVVRISDPAQPVSLTLRIYAGKRLLATVARNRAARRLALTARVTTPPTRRGLRLELTATDSLGNSRVVRRFVQSAR